MINCSSHETSTLFNRYIVDICSAPSGIMHSCLSYSVSNVYKLEMLVNKSIVGSFDLKLSTNSHSGKILWSSLGDNICIIFANEVIFIHIEYIINDEKVVSMCEALETIEPAHIYSDIFIAKLTVKKRLNLISDNNTSATISGCLIDIGRFIVIGTTYGKVLKLSWEGQIVDEISCDNEEHNYDLLRPVGSYPMTQTECSISTTNMSKSRQPPISVLSSSAPSLDHEPLINGNNSGIHSNNSVYIQGYSESTRSLIVSYNDDSWRNIHFTSTKTYISPNIRPVLYLRPTFGPSSSGRPVYTDLYGREFSSQVLTSSEVMTAAYTSPSSDAAASWSAALLPLVGPSLGVVRWTEAPSHIVSMRIIDSSLVCEPGTLLAVCLVYTLHTSSSPSHAPDPGAPHSQSSTGPGYTISTVVVRIRYPTLTSPLQPAIKAVAASTADSTADKGTALLTATTTEPVVSARAPVAVAVASHDRVLMECISICPLHDAKSSTHSSSMTDPLLSHTDVLVEVLYLPDAVRLLVFANGYISCRSLTDASIYFVMSLRDLHYPTAPMHSKEYRSSGSGAVISQNMTVLRGCAIVSSSVNSPLQDTAAVPNPTKDMSTGIAGGVGIKSVLSRVPLTVGCTSPLQGQNRDVLVSYTEPISLHLHHLTSPQSSARSSSKLVPTSTGDKNGANKGQGSPQLTSESEESDEEFLSHWKDMYFNDDTYITATATTQSTLPSTATSSSDASYSFLNSCIPPRVPALHVNETTGAFQSIPLPYRLTKDLLLYQLHSGIHLSHTPGDTECALIQDGILVASTTRLIQPKLSRYPTNTAHIELEHVLSRIQSTAETKPVTTVHSRADYIAVSIGGCYRSQSVANAHRAHNSTSSTPLNRTLWLYNCDTRRWRETYLGITVDVKHDKTYGKLLVLSELRSATFSTALDLSAGSEPTPRTRSHSVHPEETYANNTGAESAREGKHNYTGISNSRSLDPEHVLSSSAASYTSPSSLAGPLKSISSIAW